MFTIVKTVTLDCAHCLPNHRGKCATVHGHTYNVEITIQSKLLNDEGMVVDFGIISSVLTENYDHKFLNDLSSFGIIPTTTEHLAKLFWEDIQLVCSAQKNRPQCTMVRVWESATSCALYTPCL